MSATLLALRIAVAAILVFGFGGWIFFNQARVDPPSRVDAIIVLGGQHDGREIYGIELARQGFSGNVVLSDPYSSSDKKMQGFCSIKDARFIVTCVRPSPGTTRGEAIFTRELAERFGWRKVLVISWRYHLPRARHVFAQCFEGDVTMRAVPRSYNYSLARWEYTYLYQSIGFAKAVIQGSC